MSRNITISFRDGASATDTPIEVVPPYSLLGGQQSSMAFWRIPRIKQVGVERLSELGVGDPVYFFGWEEMPLLGQELFLLSQHLPSIDFHIGLKVEWLSHLIYCYHFLTETAPKVSIPIFGVG